MLRGFSGSRVGIPAAGSCLSVPALPALAKHATPPPCSACRTRTAFKSLNPEYDEFFELGNVPPTGCRLDMEVRWQAGLVCCCSTLVRDARH